MLCFAQTPRTTQRALNATPGRIAATVTRRTSLRGALQVSVEKVAQLARPRLVEAHAANHVLATEEQQERRLGPGAQPAAPVEGLVDLEPQVAVGDLDDLSG